MFRTRTRGRIVISGGGERHRGKRQDARRKAPNHPPPPPPRHGLDNRVGVFGYLCLCLNVFFFHSLLVADPKTFYLLNREDNWTENLTAVWFLLAGFLLFAAALVERSFFRRCVYVLGGMAMMFVAGEEISWGQRIFGFATPDFLMRLNESKEFNVHNIANDLFYLIHMNGTLVLCMITGAAFFCRKDRLFGIPLPSIPLMLGFLIMISYASGANFTDYFGNSFRENLRLIRISLGFIIIEEKGLLILFLIFALFSGHVKLVIASAATLALVLVLAYLNYHSMAVKVYIENLYGIENLYDLRVRWGLFEVREYLFGICCLFYCLEILLARERLAAIPRAPFTALKPPVRWIPSWAMTCSLVIAGSIGLIFFEYLNATAKTAAIEEAYRSITAGEPVVRSSFDVYLTKNRLVYVKEPCAPADTKPRFFLHIIPDSANDLPDDRKQHGFDNLDFNFSQNSGRYFGGKCLAIGPLPDYKIASIRTGQFIPGKGRIWMGTFTVNR